MAALSIRDLDDGVRDRLRLRAAAHGRSMEAEAREILTAAVGEVRPVSGLAQAVRARFAALGGVELDLPDRATSARPIDL